MRFSRFARWQRLLLAIALLMLGWSASGAITPESDVLVPWFEIDLIRDDAGLETSYSIVNASANAVRTRFTVYTNWGIPVLEVPVGFNRAEAKSINFHVWITHGQLPDRTLSPAELANLQAALTGQPSPEDGLYRGTAYKEGIAVGYVVVQTLDERPDTLWGDTYVVDPSVNYFGAETLFSLTHDLKADCNRNSVRFVNEDRLFEGTQLIIWTGRRFQPSTTPTPNGVKVKATAEVYDQAGHHVQTCRRELIAVELVEVCHLDITPPIGWLDIATEDPAFILEHLHSTSAASAQLHSWCLRTDLKIEGPGITLEKRVEEHQADHPPGPKINVGEPITFQYYVTNSGTVPLTTVSVSDDTGLVVTCPKATLDVGETMVCTASSIAAGCENANVGTAIGTAPDGARVSSIDVAYYAGVYASALTLELLVNDNEADHPPVAELVVSNNGSTGPFVEAGELLHWTFVVTNSGDSPLTGIAVSRKNGEPATCPKTELAVGESMTCTSESIALEGLQHEIATATGDDPCFSRVVATDPAYYFGRKRAPSITIEKYVGQDDADTAPGPTLQVGTTIQWQFVVTNTGNVPLSGIAVTDDQGIAVTCPKIALEPGQSMTCTASSPVLPCDHVNIAGVSGTTAREENVSAQDPAHYFGESHPAVTLEMNVNGDPADTPPGPWIDENDSVLFTYEVTNIGDVTLTNIVVSDDHDRSALCPKTTLDPGQSMTCTASTLAVAGTHEVIGSVYGAPPCGELVHADDPVYYRGRALLASIDVLKMTNGVHADEPPGPVVAIGTAVEWSYLVTNTGTLTLTNVTVTDSGQIAVTCPKTALEPGESMTCVAGGIAQPCQYSNTATASGQPSSGEPVSAVDQSFYYGQHHAAIRIDKRLNGEDAPNAPGPSITVGSTLQWTFIATNTGDVALTDVTVTDDRAGAVTCPKSTLAVGESMTCTASGLALPGPQRNVASVTGKPPCGDEVPDSDANYYVGVNPGINIEKLINGQDADDAAHAVPLSAGDPIMWSFVVTNTGDVTLESVGVSDSQLALIQCPKNALAAGESMTCIGASSALAGSHCNIATATGISPQDVTVTATDSACYVGSSAAISIEKKTNGVDADTPPGPEVPVESMVSWTYVLTNTGDVRLANVVVSDNRGVVVTCPKTTLEPGESMTCTASGIAVQGQYSNIGTAFGTPPSGDSVSASDPSHYLGVAVADQGCTPGYWKNHTGSWPPTGYTPGQTVVSVFAQSALHPALGASTLLNALSFAGGPGVSGAAEILLRAATAALLNASHTAVNYPRLASDVINDVNAALATQNRDVMLSLAAALDADNNRGCPLN